MGKTVNVQRLDPVFTPDKSRVLIRPFVPGSPSRIKSILRRVLGMSEAEVQQVYATVMKEFRGRHHNLEDLFQKRYHDVQQFLPAKSKASPAMQLLIGSYFTCEYALEAAALFNPSIVPHPVQVGAGSGSLKFVMSLRATGEGHISSIEFRTGVIDASGRVTLDPRSPITASPDVDENPEYHKDQFILRIKDEGHWNPTTKELVDALPDHFRRSQLQTAIARVRRKYKKLAAARVVAMEYVESLLALNYGIVFQPGLDLSELVIFPVSSFESNGIEDARFVQFTDSGTKRYYATYTAYNGKQIMPLLLETDDFRTFRIRSLSGKAARNKGMALFPRKIRGHYVMISRQDGENLYCAYSDDMYSWKKPASLLEPSMPWEFTQIGNCGSPIETEKGWLLLTHGVGPVRKYCIGAILLDRDDPSRVIGQLKGPLIAPDESERSGYVPNVVYTCGAIAHNGKLVVPYAMSDQSSRFATVGISELLSAME